MEEKLKKLYKECLEELKSIDINLDENTQNQVNEILKIANDYLKKY